MCPFTMWHLTLEVAGGTQVTASVARVEIEKGGDVVLRDGAKHGLSNNLKWLDLFHPRILLPKKNR